MEAFWKIRPTKEYSGVLAEIPQFSINNFTEDDYEGSPFVAATKFFLTYCDYDILAYVFRSGFLENLAESKDESLCLFLHEITYKFLVYWTSTTNIDEEDQQRYRDLLQQLVTSNKIVFLVTNKPVDIPVDSFTVTVTPLSSGHQAGSIMLLLEKSSIDSRSQVDLRIVHTGCCRLNLKDLRLLTPLHDSQTGRPKEIHHLYLDTSFCTRNVTEFPSRRVVTEKLLKLTEAKIAEDSEIRFDLMDDLVSTRFPPALNVHFLCCVFEHTEEPIHAPKPLVDFHRNIPGLPSNLSTAAADGDSKISNYHCFCGQDNDNELCSEKEWGLDFDVNEICLQSNFSSRESEDDLQVFKAERNWKVHGYEKTVYSGTPTSHHAIYCSNLSRYEQARMINYLKVSLENVHPLYTAFGVTTEDMQSLLAEACDVAHTEPQEIVDDHPSHFYDCTGASNTVISYVQLETWKVAKAALPKNIPCHPYLL